jgi:hypothetical protein
VFLVLGKGSGRLHGLFLTVSPLKKDGDYVSCVERIGATLVRMHRSYTYILSSDTIVFLLATGWEITHGERRTSLNSPS